MGWSPSRSVAAVFLLISLLSAISAKADPECDRALRAAQIQSVSDAKYQGKDVFILHRMVATFIGRLANLKTLPEKRAANTDLLAFLDLNVLFSEFESIHTFLREKLVPLDISLHYQKDGLATQYIHILLKKLREIPPTNRVYQQLKDSHMEERLEVLQAMLENRLS